MADKSNAPGHGSGRKPAKHDGAENQDMSFEEALAALETVVGQLEAGQVPLEESIALYERGDALRKHCEERLKSAEMKVEKIVGGGAENPDRELFDSDGS